jgi:hypothetical protein
LGEGSTFIGSVIGEEHQFKVSTKSTRRKIGRSDPDQEVIARSQKHELRMKYSTISALGRDDCVPAKNWLCETTQFCLKSTGIGNYQGAELAAPARQLREQY